MLGTLNAIRRERAERARDVAYIRELSAEDVDDRINYADRELNGRVDQDGFKGIPELVNRISAEDTTEVEVNRILKSNKDLTFDEMIGIE